MLEIRNELPYGIDNFGFGEVVFGKDAFQLLKETIHLGLVVTECSLLYTYKNYQKIKELQRLCANRKIQRYN